MSHVLVLANRNAGGGRATRALPELLRRLRDAGHGITLIDEPTRERADHAMLDVTGVDTLIACGGDGTVHTALQHALRTGLPLGIVPAGSGDDAARAIGLPHGRRRRDVRRAIVHCVENLGSSRAVDVIWAETADANREAYLGVLAAGFDSIVNARANSLRFPPGTAKYVWAMIAELGRFTAIPYRLEFEQHALDVTGMLIAVGNGSTYGGGMKVCPGADVHDGIAEILIVGELPKFTFLRLFPKVFTGAHVQHPAARVVHASAFTLIAPGQTAWADGEFLGPTPIRISVERDAVQVVGAP